MARAWFLAPLPAIALFLIYSNYNHPLAVGLAVSLGLLLSLGFEWVSQTRLAGLGEVSWLPGRPSLAHIVVCCLWGCIGLWLGGAGALLVFATTTLVYEVVVHGRWTTVAVALPASAALTWALAGHVYLIPAREAFLILSPFAQSATNGLDTFLQIQVFLLYIFVPLAILLVCTGKHVLGRRGSNPARHSRQVMKKERRVATARTRPWGAMFGKSASAALPFVLLASALYINHKELRKPSVLSNYYFQQKQWNRILELAGRLPKGQFNVFVNHDILRALYHTGRLPYDMFRYPLKPEAILLTHEGKQTDLTEWKLSDILLELGQVNTAQKLASELIATKSHLGIALEELGWINIIKGCPATARVYLNALSQDLVYGARARSLLHSLDNGFTPEQAAYIDRIRSFMPNEPTAMTGGESVDETLAGLLQHNPHNKMAFEYLMACYLVTGQVNKIVENMGRLPSLAIPEPRRSMKRPSSSITGPVRAKWTWPNSTSARKRSGDTKRLCGCMAPCSLRRNRPYSTRLCVTSAPAISSSISSTGSG